MARQGKAWHGFLNQKYRIWFFMDFKAVQSFFARRYTSFRFSWGFFSLFINIFTFSIVLTTKFPQYDAITVVILTGVCFVLFAVLLDMSGLRQRINVSESNSNPLMMELVHGVREIKDRVRDKNG